MNKLPPETLRPLQVIASALILSPLVMLGVAALVRSLGGPRADIPALMYVAVGAALLSPVLAGAMRQNVTAGFAGQPVPIEKVRGALLVSFAILEMAAFLCGLAFLLTPSYWPLLAAMVPLGAMALWFPR